MIEIEVQNESHQTQERLKFVAVPRIGEGIRLREPDGFWTSYDVLDVWYQKAEFGDIWIPYVHVRMTPAAQDAEPQAQPQPQMQPQMQPVPSPLYDQPAPASSPLYEQPPRATGPSPLYPPRQAAPAPDGYYRHEEAYPFTA